MNSAELMHSIIQRIATGPELSKSISLEESELAMKAILKNEINEVQSAIFLIAMRMKRETLDENIGILLAILSSINSRQSSVENLIDIGDPYSGFNRSIPISSFLPPLLAELGFPTVIHGLDSVSPKFGLTHRHIYKAINQNVDFSISDALNRVEDGSIGWTYIDQSKYCEPLHDLVPLRNKLIKRTVLNTVESLIGPIKGVNTHSILGYVHKPYPPIYASLANQAGFSSSLLIRGVEGGVVPSLRQKGMMVSYFKGVEKDRVEIDPKVIGINHELRAISFPKEFEGLKNRDSLATYVAELGLSALSGKVGMFYDGLVYSASLILWHIGEEKTLLAASEKVRAVLDSSSALVRIEDKQN